MFLPFYDIVYEYNIYILVILFVLFLINKFVFHSSILQIIIFVLAAYALYASFKKVKNYLFRTNEDVEQMEDSENDAVKSENQVQSDTKTETKSETKSQTKSETKLEIKPEKKQQLPTNVLQTIESYLTGDDLKNFKSLFGQA